MRRRSILASEGVQLKHDEYRLLRELFRERFGIHFADDSRFSVERRLRERLVVRGHQSFAEYHDFLKFRPLAQDEWAEIAEVLTVHETYFFREDYQLTAFKDEVLPELRERAKARKRITIWSAGCSTGEEVYTIAMLVHESMLFDGWEVRVYGSDLSKRCVAAARRGLYGPNSFRTTREDIKRKYFRQTDGGWLVSDEIRSMCHFSQMNLLDSERTHLVGRVDAIFCRNVLIYFDSEARKRVIDMFQERLAPGGVLLLGHSESLLNVSTAFELLHLKGDLVYKKPLNHMTPFSPPSSGSGGL